MEKNGCVCLRSLCHGSPSVSKILAGVSWPCIIHKARLHATAMKCLDEPEWKNKQIKGAWERRVLP